MAICTYFFSHDWVLAGIDSTCYYVSPDDTEYRAILRLYECSCCGKRKLDELNNVPSTMRSGNHAGIESRRRDWVEMAAMHKEAIPAEDYLRMKNVFKKPDGSIYFREN